MASLPPGYRTEPGHQGRWLVADHARRRAGWPARRGVLAAVVAERDLAGARDQPSVIDARLRRQTGSLVRSPQDHAGDVPAIADPERQADVAEIAAMMDARKDRLGEHAVGHAMPWATTANWREIELE